MEIISDIADLEKALKNAEYYAAHLISDIVSNYDGELDTKKKEEIENLEDAAINALDLVRNLKNPRRDASGKGLVEFLTALYEMAKNKDYKK